jgi:hypothetical protein
MMNERIRKLIRNLDNEIGRYYWTDKEKEKFAELIVRECLLKIENERFELPDFIIDSVKEHFGVAE